MDQTHEYGYTEQKNIHQEHHQMLLEQFLNPFLEKINNFEGENYTENELIDELKNIYSGPTFCIGCHINAFKYSIIDNLNEYNSINNIRNNIIIPTIIDILEYNQVDTEEIQTSTTEEWYIEQEKQPKPVSDEIIKDLLQRPTEIIEDDVCFCGDDNDKEVIKLNCCGKYVHLNCILEWFKTNNTCPYCREKYT